MSVACAVREAVGKSMVRLDRSSEMRWHRRPSTSALKSSICLVRRVMSALLVLTVPAMDPNCSPNPLSVVITSASDFCRSSILSSTKRVCADGLLDAVATPSKSTERQLRIYWESNPKEIPNQLVDVTGRIERIRSAAGTETKLWYQFVISLVMCTRDQPQ